MANFRNILQTTILLIFLVSCSNGQTKNDKAAPAETPQALQDNKLEIKSYSRSGDLIEELYQELVDKTKLLKKLEDDLDAFSPEPNKLKEKFDKYDSKSKSYYSSANYKTMAITDSLLRKKIISLIATSSRQYANNTEELNSLLKQVNANNSTLNDYHNVLKIVLTLPMIEKYQKENKLDKTEFKNLIKNQELLISRTDSLTPKY